MKQYKILIIFLIAFLFASNISAQSPRFVDTLASREATSLRKNLSLNTSQERMVEQAFKTHFLLLNKLNETDRNLEEKQKALSNLNNIYLKRLESILTATQFKNYNQLIHSKSAAFKARTAGKGIKILEVDENSF